MRYIVKALGLGLGDSYIQIIMIYSDSNINLPLLPYQLLPIAELLPYGDSMPLQFHSGFTPWRRAYSIVTHLRAVTIGDTY